MGGLGSKKRHEACRALLFDLDNTLIDRDAAMSAWAKQWPVSDTIKQNILKADGQGQGNRHRLPGLLDIYHPQQVPWTLAGIAAQVASFVEPDSSVLALIERLQRSYQVAIVTNGGSSPQREKLRRSGLDALVSCVTISGELGVAKPASKIFEHALATLGCPAHQALFVGDSLGPDIKGASAAGLRTCWVTKQSTQANDADVVIDELSKLEEVVTVIWGSEHKDAHANC